VSTQDVDSPNWRRAENIRYYGHFYNALKDFAESDYDIFIFNAGDMGYNNYAEYTGLIMGLKQVASFLSQHIKDNTSHEGTPAYRVRVFGDSNLVVQQVNGCWQCKNDNIRALYNEARTLYCGLGTIGNCGEITLQHVYREQNKVADGESMVYPLNPNSRSTHY
jgi:ribonuclease HI